MSGWKRSVACLLVALLAAGTYGTAQNRGGDNSSPPPVDSAALAREALAEAMVSQNESIHGRKYGADFRAELKAAVSSMPSERLGSLNPLTSAFIPDVEGDSAADTVFTPVPPCRAVNFVRINPGVNPSFATLTGFCGIPFGPTTTVMMNIIAVDPAGNGDLRVFPSDQGVPPASVINYGFPGTGFNIANGLAVPVCNPAFSGCPTDITVQADGAAVTLVIDVYGYYAARRPMEAVINGNATIARSSNTISVVRSPDGAGRYIVRFNRDITGCEFNATLGIGAFIGLGIPGFIDVAGANGTTDSVYVRTLNTAGANTDIGFHIYISCPRRAGI